MAHTKAQIKKIDSDVEYWKSIAEILGCTVHSFTDRSLAYLRPPEEHKNCGLMKIDRWLAEKLQKITQ